MAIADRDVQHAIEVLDRHRHAWLRRPNVAAVDVGFPIHGDRMLTDEVAIRIHLEEKLDPSVLAERDWFGEAVDPDDRRRGQHVDGVPIDIIEAVYEPMAARPDPPIDPADAGDLDRTARFATLLGGMSVGNPRVSAGTLGAIVFDRIDGSPHVLSNWHVLAGSAARPGSTAGVRGAEPHYHGVEALAGPEPHYHALAGPEPHYHALAGIEPHYHALSGAEPHYHGSGAEPHYHPASPGAPHLQSAAVGEPIYQPGRFDGGVAADTVARLHRLRLDTAMDAAIACLSPARPYAATLLGLGPVTGTARAELGTEVVKSGRSTRVTEGIVDGLSLSTTITYDHGPQTFHGQIHIVPRAPWPRGGRGAVQTSEPGDSGALWVTRTSDGLKAVGLHFGGDLTGTRESEHSLANPIDPVVEALDVSLTPLVGYLPGPKQCADRRGAGGGRGDLSTEVAALSAAAMTADGATARAAKARLRLLRCLVDTALDADRDC